MIGGDISRDILSYTFIIYRLLTLPIAHSCMKTLSNAFFFFTPCLRENKHDSSKTCHLSFDSRHTVLF